MHHLHEEQERGTKSSLWSLSGAPSAKLVYAAGGDAQKRSWGGLGSRFAPWLRPVARPMSFNTVPRMSSILSRAFRHFWVVGAFRSCQTDDLGPQETRGVSTASTTDTSTSPTVGTLMVSTAWPVGNTFPFTRPPCGGIIKEDLAAGCRERHRWHNHRYTSIFPLPPRRMP